MKLKLNFKKLKNSQLLPLFVMLILAYIFAVIVQPSFLRFSQLMLQLKLATFIGIIALAQTIVIVVGGEGLDLSAGAIATFSAVVAYITMNGNNAMVIPSLLLVLSIGFIFGMINGTAISYLGIPPLIMTLAMSSVITGMLYIYSGGNYIQGRTASLLLNVGRGNILGIPNLVIIWAVVAFLAYVFLSKTKFGKKLYGVGSNETAADMSGVKSKKIRALAYGLGGIVSALAGFLLLGYMGQAFLDMGSQYNLPSIAAAVIGGISLAGGEGKYSGVILGALFLTIISSVLVSLQMGDAGKNVVYAIVLIVIMTIYQNQKKVTSQ